MATVNDEGSEAYTISVTKLIEILQKLPEDTTIWTMHRFLNTCKQNPENFWMSEPVGLVDMLKEEFSPSKPLRIRSIDE